MPGWWARRGRRERVSGVAGEVVLGAPPQRGMGETARGWFGDGGGCSGWVCWGRGSIWEGVWWRCRTRNGRRSWEVVGRVVVAVARSSRRERRRVLLIVGGWEGDLFWFVR